MLRLAQIHSPTFLQYNICSSFEEDPRSATPMNRGIEHDVFSKTKPSKIREVLKPKCIQCTLNVLSI